MIENLNAVVVVVVVDAEKSEAAVALLDYGDARKSHQTLTEVDISAAH